MAYKSTYVKSVPAGSYRKKKEQQQPQIKVKPPQPEKSGAAIRIPTVRQQSASKPIAQKISVPQSAPTQQRQQIKIGDIAGSHPKLPAPIKISHIPTQKTKQTVVSSPPNQRDVSSVPQIKTTVPQPKNLIPKIGLPNISRQTNLPTFPGLPLGIGERLKADQPEVLRLLLDRAYKNARAAEGDGSAFNDKLHQSAKYWIALYNENLKKPTLTLDAVNHMGEVLEQSPKIDWFKNETLKTLKKSLKNFFGNSDSFGGALTSGASNLIYYLAAPAMFGFANGKGRGLIDTLTNRIATEGRNAVIPPKYRGIITLGNISTAADTTYNPNKIMEILRREIPRAYRDTMRDIGFPSPTDVHNAVPSVDRQLLLQSFFKNYQASPREKTGALAAKMLTNLANNFVAAMPSTVGPVGINKPKLLMTAQNMIYNQFPPESLTMITELERLGHEGLKIPYQTFPTQSPTVMLPKPQIAGIKTDIASISDKVSIPQMLEGRQPVILPTQPGNQPENRPENKPENKPGNQPENDDPSSGFTETMKAVGVLSSRNVEMLDKQLGEATKEKKELENNIDSQFEAGFKGSSPQKIRKNWDKYQNSYANPKSKYQTNVYTPMVTKIGEELGKTVQPTIFEKMPSATPEQRKQAENALRAYYNTDIQIRNIRNAAKNEIYNMKYKTAYELSKLQEEIDDAEAVANQRQNMLELLLPAVQKFAIAYNNIIPSANQRGNDNYNFAWGLVRAGLNGEMHLFNRDYPLNSARKLPIIDNVEKPPIREIIKIAERFDNIPIAKNGILEKSKEFQALKKAKHNLLQLVKTEYKERYGNETFPEYTDEWLGRTALNTKKQQATNLLAELNKNIDTLTKKMENDTSDLMRARDNVYKEINGLYGAGNFPIKIVNFKATQNSGGSTGKQTENFGGSTGKWTENLSEDIEKWSDDINKISKDIGVKLEKADKQGILPYIAGLTALASGTGAASNFLSTLGIGTGGGVFTPSSQFEPIQSIPSEFEKITTNPYAPENPNNLLSLNIQGTPTSPAEYVEQLNNYFLRHAKDNAVVAGIRGIKRGVSNTFKNLFGTSAPKRNEGVEMYNLKNRELNEKLIPKTNYNQIGANPNLQTANILLETNESNNPQIPVSLAILSNQDPLTDPEILKAIQKKYSKKK